METNYLINIKIVTLHLFYINCRLNENQIDFYSEYQTYRLLTPGQQLNNFALNQLVKAGHKNTFIQRTDQTELDWYFPLSINGHFLTSRLKLVNYPWQLFFFARTKTNTKTNSNYVCRGNFNFQNIDLPRFYQCPFANFKT